MEGSILSVNLATDKEDQYIYSMLKKFKLVDIRENYFDLINEAKRDNLNYKQFLHLLLQHEEQGKKRRMVARYIKNAHFEKEKTLDEYDFSFHNFQHMKKIQELSTLDFIKRKENVILIGPPGVGKSHIATGLGMKACESGKKVLFVNAVEFIAELATHASQGTLKTLFKKLARIDLIAIDELGYLKMDKEKESLFFQFIRHRYEKNALIITTNLPLDHWDEVFTSQLAATAILDRLVHHCHIVSITGDSYRVKGKKKGISQNEKSQ
jgi:DNA replication protein DnaC